MKFRIGTALGRSEEILKAIAEKSAKPRHIMGEYDHPNFYGNESVEAKRNRLMTISPERVCTLHHNIRVEGDDLVSDVSFIGPYKHEAQELLESKQGRFSIRSEGAMIVAVDLLHNDDCVPGPHQTRIHKTICRNPHYWTIPLDGLVEEIKPDVMEGEFIAKGEKSKKNYTAASVFALFESLM